MNCKFQDDYIRRFKHFDLLPVRLFRYIQNHEIRILYWARGAENGGVFKYLYKLMMLITYRKYGCVLNSRNIEGGILLCYAHNIIINNKAIIGKNCTIFGGTTIGSVRSGKRKGVPVIGDNVVLGMNSFVCGGIHIGNDVLIAANSFVDFDVPDHSLVFGNPGVIKHKDQATIDYV